MDKDAVRALADGSALRGRLSPGAGAVVSVQDAGSASVFYLGEGVTESTVLEIGSVTKVFTGMLLALAIQSGRLSQESSLCEVLDIPRGAGQPIRIRDLLTHSSGLPRISISWLSRWSRDPYASYSREQLLSYLHRRGCERPADAGYLYSNLGYATLGAVLETVYQAPFAVLLRDQLLAAWGLAESHLADLSGAAAPGFKASGAAAAPWHWQAYAACGAMRGTAAEVMSVLDQIGSRAGLPGGVYDLCDQALTPHGSQPEVGFGWMFDRSTGWRWHNGATGGYSAYLAMANGEKRCVAVLANQHVPQETTQLGQALVKQLM